MFWIKKCPRCRGDLISESDIHGAFISCLQCGHLLTAAEEAVLNPLAMTAVATATEATMNTNRLSSFCSVVDRLPVCVVRLDVCYTKFQYHLGQT